jgi:cystathionine beta-lyase
MNGRYDFDTEIDRRGTHCIKWEYTQSETDPTQMVPTGMFFGPDRHLPLWIADMDLPCPQPVVDALAARARHPIYGYTNKTDDYLQAVVGWMRRRYGWEIASDWICTAPGVVPALAHIVRAFTAPGETVLVQRPVYYPFSLVAELNGRVAVSNSLIYENGRYRMDFDDLEAKAADPQARMLILCSPHNPVGRVWTRGELARLGEICLAHDVLVVSDEIHADLTLPGCQFTSFATLSPEFERRSITCTAPSKTFNLAGLQTSNIIIPDADLRARFAGALLSSGLLGNNAFGAVALEAAYNHGEDWLAQLLDYLDGNRRFLEAFVAARLPAVRVVPTEGTYLAWLDCRGLGLDAAALQHLMRDEARVYLDEGPLFGPEGEGFERINFACPRALLAEALERIAAAVATSRRASAT